MGDRYVPAAQSTQRLALLCEEASEPVVTEPAGHVVQAALYAPVEYMFGGQTAQTPLRTYNPGPQFRHFKALLCASAVLPVVPVPGGQFANVKLPEGEKVPGGSTVQTYGSKLQEMVTSCR